MTHTARNKADVEHAVMLAVVNFQKEFMQSNYSHVQVRLRETLLEVDLTRAVPIPAEERLAQSQEGRAQLRQMNQALFIGGRDMLRKELEDILGGAIYEMSTDLDPLSGKKTMVIRFDVAYNSRPHLTDHRTSSN